MDVTAHLGVPDAEEDEHDAEKDEEQRLADDAHHRECGGHDTRDHHERGGRREDGEQQSPRAEPVGTQGTVLTLECIDAAAVGGGLSTRARRT